MRFLLNRAVVAALLLALAGAAQAQPLPVQVDLDYATFAYAPEETLLEVYLSFGASSFAYDEVEGVGYKASLPVLMGLYPDAQSTTAVWADNARLQFTLADTTGFVGGKFFVHQLRAPVAPGSYELRIMIPPDAALERQQLEVRRTLDVPSYGRSTSLAISDVVLSNGILNSADRNDPFFKNDLSVRPNVSRLYGKGVSDVYYYAEVYNPSGTAGPDGQYTLTASVVPAGRTEPVGALVRTMARESRSPDVVVGSFDVAGLATGSYLLRLAVLNDAGAVVGEQSRKFFVYNPDVARQEAPAVDVTFEGSRWAGMSEEEVRQAFEHVDIIANDSERRRIRNLNTLQDRQRFLMEFWNKRNPNPGSAFNMYQEEFTRRLQYVSERYAESQMPGWKTDRGRTFIKYGQPTHIEPHLYDREVKPHEIWQYNNIPGEGQATFVFADRTGFGQFEMIHSTVAGERSLPEWEVELRR